MATILWRVSIYIATSAVARKATSAGSLIQNSRAKISSPVQNYPEALPKTCLISPPYISEHLPDYVCFLKQSVEANAGLKFFLISNASLPSDCKEATGQRNFAVVPHSASNFADRAQSYLNFSVSEATALAESLVGRKSCDLKPALAQLYPELLRGCEFWGWSDIDLVFGDLSSLNLQQEDGYDIFSPYAAMPCKSMDSCHVSAGPLTILRNRPRTRSLFMDAPDWTAIFLNSSYQVFDEWWGPDVIQLEKTSSDFNSILLNACDVKIHPAGQALFGQCINDQPAGLCGYEKSEFDPSDVEMDHDLAQRLALSRTAMWSNGELLVKDAAGMMGPSSFFHFVFRKGTESFNPPSPWKRWNCYIINSAGMVPCG